MMSTPFGQLLLASSITLAVLATMPAPRPVSATPLIEAVRALVALDLCPGGGVLSCALKRD
jgi:hypothetical protein